MGSLGPIWIESTLCLGKDSSRGVVYGGGKMLSKEDINAAKNATNTFGLCVKDFYSLKFNVENVDINIFIRN